MSEFERSAPIPASAEQVFSFVSNPENLPRFLPSLKGATFQPDGTFQVQDARGYYRADEASHRMEWGAQAAHNYNGWLQVEPEEGGSSRLTVHLSFAPREGAPTESGDRDRTITDTVDRTLLRIRELVTSGN